MHAMFSEQLDEIANASPPVTERIPVPLSSLVTTEAPAPPNRVFPPLLVEELSDDDPDEEQPLEFETAEECLLHAAMVEYCLPNDLIERRRLAPELGRRLIESGLPTVAERYLALSPDDEYTLDIMKDFMLSSTSEPEDRQQAAYILRRRLIATGLPRVAASDELNDNLPPPISTPIKKQGYTTKVDMPPNSPKVSVDVPKLALRNAVNAKRLGRYVANNKDLDHAKATWHRITEIKSEASGLERHIHQNEPEVTPYISMLESLLGDPRHGRRMGLRAVYTAFWTESPRLDGANPDLSNLQRAGAKAKALKNGVTAVAVSLLASSKVPLLKKQAWSVAGSVFGQRKR